MRLHLLICICFGVVSSLAAQNRRVAVVIGNSAYPGAPLVNAVGDAIAVSAALHKTGFTLVPENPDEQNHDLGYSGMQDRINLMRRYGQKADLLLVYYAGHAAQFEQEHYLLPVDAVIETPADIKRRGIPVNQIIDVIEESPVKKAILVIDACRTDVAGHPEGGASFRASSKVFISLSTTDGQAAADGRGALHSPFADAFITGVNEPPQAVPAFFEAIGQAVRDATNSRQVPEYTATSASWNKVFLTGAVQPLPSVVEHNWPDAEQALEIDHEVCLAVAPDGEACGLVKPAASQASAVRRLPQGAVSAAPGWIRVQISGWMVASSPDRRQRLQQVSGDKWCVADQGGKSPDDNQLSVRSERTLSENSIIAALREGVVVQRYETVKDGRRVWCRCAWTGWVNVENPSVEAPVPVTFKKSAPPVEEGTPEEAVVGFETQLVFPHPSRPATRSTRKYYIGQTSRQVEMIFTNEREDGSEPRQGHVMLNGEWQGQRFTSSSQTVVGEYTGWINERMVLDFSGTFADGRISCSFKRLGQKQPVTAQGELHPIE